MCYAAGLTVLPWQFVWKLPCPPRTMASGSALSRKCLSTSCTNTALLISLLSFPCCLISSAPRCLRGEAFPSGRGSTVSRISTAFQGFPRVPKAPLGDPVRLLWARFPFGLPCGQSEGADFKLLPQFFVLLFRPALFLPPLLLACEFDARDVARACPSKKPLNPKPLNPENLKPAGPASAERLLCLAACFS